jgi:hypothetical protein
VTIGGVPITFGGQIAQHITMRLTGVASVTTSVHNVPIPCEGAGAVPPLAFAAAAPPFPKRGAV